MGFLDHSTNNIIVDAVLTDAGRQALARNDGSFSIYQFSLGDDEVDYNIIQQFGRTVGKEKIEKNTPVLEAVTQGSLGLKYPLISVSNQFLTHLPVMTLTTKSTPVTFDRKSNTSIQNITVDIENKTGVSIEFDLLDAEVLVEVNHLFLAVVGESPDIIYTDNIAVYRYPTNQETTGETIRATIPIRLKSFSTTTFSNYSVSGASFVKTFVKILGVNSGLSKTIEVQIS
tara:strand:+ start:2431 stop:3117 length:687 start_codon:yes stop_codon:yes gene_type:complete